MSLTRRHLLLGSAAAAAAARTPRALAQTPAAGVAEDRVFICNEDSNTLAVIDPRTNSVSNTINLTSFDEDPRPPFRLVTGGVTPTHLAMVRKPLYHGAIDIHGAAPSPDNDLIATTGRGTSNVYLIDTAGLRVLGNRPNPQAGDTTNRELVTSGILVGREPHEPTFTRNGRELWVTVRGENRIALIDVNAAKSGAATERAVRGYVETIDGPAQVWFARDGRTAFVASQKLPQVDLIETNFGGDGTSRPRRLRTVDIRAQDPRGFTPFLKTSPEGAEVWFSHKLADAVSAWTADQEFRLLDRVPLGENARPNHIEFVENARGKAVYVSLARVDDAAGHAASSRIAIIDRAAGAGSRKVVGQFYSMGREAHGLWTNPEGTRLYIAHEQDELPNTPNAGQTICSAFDVADPFAPKFITQIPLGDLALPSGRLRNKKSINLVYVRPNTRSQAG